MGEAGVAKALSLIADELRVSMSLTGVRDVADVSCDILFDNVDGRRPARPATTKRPKAKTYKK
jgi:L-lactate dehydrogenase (cytochrome)